MAENNTSAKVPFIKEQETIFRTCRLRAKDSNGKKLFPSREDVESAFQIAGKKLSAESIKKYECGKSIPPADKVIELAELYGTPELKWMYCSKACPIGQEITHADEEIGSDDIYFTFYEIAGAFDKVDEVEKKIHAVINDKTITEDEIPALQEALAVMDRITENARDLRIWCAKAGVKV